VTRLRVGVLGLSHDHVWGNLAVIAAGAQGALVAVAEPDPRLRARLAREHSGVAALLDYGALLERSDLDALLCFTDNRAAAEWGARALARGLPVMVEKPMAADLAGADALLTAAREAGRPLMINWPTAWRPALRHGLTLVAGGAIGEPVQLSHRGGHAGPREYGCSEQFCEWLYDPARNGGGALVDYCGYGGILARTLLGRPETVTAVAAHLRKKDLPAEDNAVVVLRYPRALAVLEGSWTQIGGEPGFAVLVYGDAGTLIVHQPRAVREGQTVGAGRVPPPSTRPRSPRASATASRTSSLGSGTAGPSRDSARRRWGVTCRRSSPPRCARAPTAAPSRWRPGPSYFRSASSTSITRRAIVSSSLLASA
jgi:predicted dehydrogenase